MILTKWLLTLLSNCYRICLLKIRQKSYILVLEVSLPVIFTFVLGGTSRTNHFQREESIAGPEKRLNESHYTINLWTMVSKNSLYSPQISSLSTVMSSRTGKTVTVRRQSFASDAELEEVVERNARTRQNHATVTILLIASPCNHTNQTVCKIHITPFLYNFFNFYALTWKYDQPLVEEVLTCLIICLYSDSMSQQGLLDSNHTVQLTTKGAECSYSSKLSFTTQFFAVWIPLSFTCHNILFITSITNDRLNRFDVALQYLNRSRRLYTLSWYLMAVVMAGLMAAVYGLNCIVFLTDLHGIPANHFVYLLLIYSSSMLALCVTVCQVTRSVSVAVWMCLGIGVTSYGLFLTLFLSRALWFISWRDLMTHLPVCHVEGCPMFIVNIAGTLGDVWFVFITMSLVSLILCLLVFGVFFVHSCAARVYTARYFNRSKMRPKRSKGSTKPVLTFERIHLVEGWFCKRKSILSHFSMSIERNDISVLLAHDVNTLSKVLEIMIGERAPTKGRILMEAGLHRDNIALCPPYDFLSDALTVQETFNYFAMMQESKTSYDDDLAKLIQALDLEGRLDTRTCNLSFSMRRLLTIAILFLQPAALFALDDPTGDLDHSSLGLATKIIRSQQGCKTVFMTSPHAEDAVLLATNLIFLGPEGTLTEGSPSTVAKRIGIGARLTVRTLLASPVDVLLIYLRMFIPGLIHLPEMTQHYSKKIKELHFFTPDANSIEFIVVNLPRRTKLFQIISFAVTDINLHDMFKKLDHPRIWSLMHQPHRHSVTGDKISVNEASEFLVTKLSHKKPEPELTYSIIASAADDIQKYEPVSFHDPGRPPSVMAQASSVTSNFSSFFMRPRNFGLLNAARRAF